MDAQTHAPCTSIDLPRAATYRSLGKVVGPGLDQWSPEVVQPTVLLLSFLMFCIPILWLLQKQSSVRLYRQKSSEFRVPHLLVQLLCRRTPNARRETPNFPLGSTLWIIYFRLSPTNRLRGLTEHSWCKTKDYHATKSYWTTAALYSKVAIDFLNPAMTKPYLSL